MSVSTPHVYQRQFDPQSKDSLGLLARWVPANSRVLELGPGTGALSTWLATSHGCTVDVIEKHVQQLDAQTRACFGQVYALDLNTPDWNQAILGQYDVVIAADVLEHLPEPAQVLEQLNRLLTPNGRLLVSVPNVAYAGLIAQLMHGEFVYRPEGLMDQSHLRWFTRASLLRFFSEAGWQVDAVQTVEKPITASEFNRLLPQTLNPALFEALTKLPDGLVYQFVMCARPAHEGQLNVTQLQDTSAPIHQWVEWTQQVQLQWRFAGQNGFYADQLVNANLAQDGQTHAVALTVPAQTQALTSLTFVLSERPGYVRCEQLRLESLTGALIWELDVRTVSHLNLQAGLISAPLEKEDGVWVFACLTADANFDLPLTTDQLHHASLGCVLKARMTAPLSADFIALSHEWRRMKAEHAYLQAERRSLQLALEAAQRSVTVSPTLAPQPIVDALPPIPTLAQTHVLPAVPEAQAAVFQAQPLMREQVRSVLVVIPVYAGFEQTKQCIQSVMQSKQHCTVQFEVLVIQDLSPDPWITAWLNQAHTSLGFKLEHNPRNLGFVRTANIGLEHAPQADVVLLNSDTQVFGDWLDRLVRAGYARDPHGRLVGTVTALSNNATLASYPQVFAQNPIPHAPAQLAQYVAQANDGWVYEVPTGVGFCMFLRRELLDAVGLLDEKRFGRGYGEECDLSRRAAKAGWVNVVAADTYVLHHGSVSFADSAQALIKHNSAVLTKLHPEYDGLVEQHMRLNPGCVLRHRIDTLRFAQSPKRNVLAINHARGGGTLYHIERLRDALNQQINVFLLTLVDDAQGQPVFELSALEPHEGYCVCIRPDEALEQITQAAQQLRIDQLHIHHLIDLPLDIAQLIARLKLPYDVTLHDLFTVCPRIRFSGPQAQFCNAQSEHDCAPCLAQSPRLAHIKIQDWRAAYHALLRGAQRVFAPSYDTYRRMLALLPLTNLHYTPHEPETVFAHGAHRLLAKSHKEDAPILRIGVMGAMSPDKGVRYLEACALDAKARGLPLQFHILGQTTVNVIKAPHSHLTESGWYDREDVAALFDYFDLQLAWFPTQTLETWCYALSEAMQAKLPIVAPDLGPFAERLHGRRWTWVVPWDLTPQQMNDRFMQMRQDHFATGRQALPPLAQPEQLTQLKPFDYKTAYVL